MSKRDFTTWKVDNLCERYAELSVRQSTASDLAQMSVVNQLGDEIREIGNELKSRPDDRGRTLMRLFHHPNLNVRLNAGRSLMNMFPEEARMQIQAIADSGKYPFAVEAGLYLSSLDGELAEMLRRN